MRSPLLHSSTSIQLAALLLVWTLPAVALAQAKATHLCTPNTGTDHDRQAFVAFDNGSVQWCRGDINCTKLVGIPASSGLTAVSLACEREQRAWVALSDGSVYRCSTAQCRKQRLQ
jgi:hypothetical protein